MARALEFRPRHRGLGDVTLPEQVGASAPRPTTPRAELGQWAGQHRNLVAGGFVDPSLTEPTGLPLLEPFGAGELLEMRGWGYRNRWIGCGLVASPHGPRAVALIAHREDPASAGFPEDSPWAEKLRIVTGSAARAISAGSALS
ncbi:hypothetical protein ACFWIO_00495 [Streptomyces diastatochromogenes]|uniref:hypothetical protein n=1 Tax=Streptomyces diastatochromogenes TaxID=42236 RepID=UPI00365EDB59